MNNPLVRTVVLLIVAVTASGANAAPVFFDDVGSFQSEVANAGGLLSNESLDSLPASALPVTTPTNIDISTDNDGAIDATPTFSGPGSSIVFFTQAGGTSITFDFDSPVNAFGLDIYDLGTVGATDLVLTTVDGSQIVFDDFVSTTGNQQFAGVVDTMTAFVSVTLTNTEPGDFVELDNLQFGQTNVIPEPTSLAIWSVLGLGAVGFRVRRRRRR